MAYSDGQTMISPALAMHYRFDWQTQPKPGELEYLNHDTPVKDDWLQNINRINQQRSQYYVRSRLPVRRYSRLE